VSKIKVGESEQVNDRMNIFTLKYKSYLYDTHKKVNDCMHVKNSFTNKSYKNVSLRRHPIKLKRYNKVIRMWKIKNEHPPTLLFITNKAILTFIVFLKPTPI
jgi:hypothetical protein